MTDSRLAPAALALLLAILAAAAFVPGLSGSFLFDDFPNIVSNRAIAMETLDADSLRKASRAYEPGLYGRPLATVTFALDHYAAGGYDAPQFKRTSLAVHVVNALLVLLLVAGVLRAAGIARPALPAFAIALGWAVHPLQVSTVLYVVQRMETLSALFVLAALWAYVRGRRAQLDGRAGAAWIVLAAGLAGVGMLAKETAVLFPLYALALELTLFGFRGASARAGRAWRIAYAAGLLAAVALFALWIMPKALDPSMHAFRGITLEERLLSQLRILPMYLGWILAPLPGVLTFYYDDYTASTGLLAPLTTLAGGLCLVALLAAAIALRRRLPLFALGVFWFFAAHFLTSNVMPFELVFEHRNYFAILGIGLALYDLLRRIPLGRPRVLGAGTAVLLVGLMALCAIRAATWGEPLLQASEFVRLNPASPRASNDLGEQYMVLAQHSADSPFYGMAEREFERGAALPGASPLPEQALILLAATAGVEAKTAWWDGIDRKLREGLIGPQEKMAVFGLLRARYDGVELDDQRLGRALGILFAREKMSPLAHVQFAHYALDHLHDDALATRQFVAAVEAEPRVPGYAVQLASALLSDGKVTQAQAVLRRAEELGLVAPEDTVPGDGR